MTIAIPGDPGYSQSGILPSMRPLRRWRRALIAGAVACLAFTAGTEHASASCADLKTSISSAQSVYTGTVDAADSAGDATVHVDEVWRGTDPGAEVELHHVPCASDCVAPGSGMLTGTQYLFLDPGLIEPLGVGCVGMVPMNGEVAALRPASAYKEGASGFSVGGGLVWLAIAVPLLGLLAVARSRLNSGRRVQGWKG